MKIMFEKSLSIKFNIDLPHLLLGLLFLVGLTQLTSLIIAMNEKMVTIEWLATMNEKKLLITS